MYNTYFKQTKRSRSNKAIRQIQILKYTSHTNINKNRRRLQLVIATTKRHSNNTGIKA